MNLFLFRKSRMHYCYQILKLNSIEFCSFSHRLFNFCNICFFSSSLFSYYWSIRFIFYFFIFLLSFGCLSFLLFFLLRLIFGHSFIPRLSLFNFYFFFFFFFLRHSPRYSFCSWLIFLYLFFGNNAWCGICSRLFWFPFLLFCSKLKFWYCLNCLILRFSFT